MPPETETSFHVDSPETLNALMDRVKTAQRIYATFSQEKVDEIFRAAALAAEYIYNKFHAEKTCGLIEHDAEFGGN